MAWLTAPSGEDQREQRLLDPHAVLGLVDTIDCGPSSTESVISSPRARQQCITARQAAVPPARR